MFENINGKEFRDVSEMLGADFNHIGFQRGSAFVDLNNDGFMDLVVTSLDEKPRILLNSADNDNHWLLVNTVGRRSNRDGIGAALKLTTASGRMVYNHVKTSTGLMSSRDKGERFRLGTQASNESHERRYPRDSVQRLSNEGPAKQLMCT